MAAWERFPAKWQFAPSGPGWVAGKLPLKACMKYASLPSQEFSRLWAAATYPEKEELETAHKEKNGGGEETAMCPSHYFFWSKSGGSRQHAERKSQEQYVFLSLLRPPHPPPPLRLLGGRVGAAICRSPLSFSSFSSPHNARNINRSFPLL